MTNYAIAGGGRLARHFSHYFHLLGIPHSCWARDQWSPLNTFKIPDAELRLKETVSNADRVLLLASDDAITDVLKQYPFLYEKQLIHCSGALSLPGIAGVHPLMTFTDDLYELASYQSLPFMCETGYLFSELFPDLPNPNFSILAEDKARYHALCVMAGNFPQLLWKGISDRFEQQFDLPASTLNPYLERVSANFVQTPESALTGPLVRNDQSTIDRNINALGDDPLQDLYRAFINFYQSNKQAAVPPKHSKMEHSA